MNISVIIPVYNVENYLRQCLDSVINQDVYEIICVNDSSTDLSPQILNEYKDKIKIINNKKNLGLGLSRNEGFKIATGDYIHFLDSDDWMEDNAYSKMKEFAKEDLDLVIFSYNNVYENKIIRQNTYDVDLSTPFNPKDKPEGLIYWDNHAWCKIHKREFLIKNRLMFNDNPCYEDILFSRLCAIAANKVAFKNDILYNYRQQRKGSLLEKGLEYSQLALSDYLKIQGLNLPHDEFAKYLLYSHFRTIFEISYGSYFRKKITYKELQDQLKTIDYSYFKGIPVKSYYRFSQDIIKYNEFIYHILYNLRKVKRVIKRNLNA